MKIEHVIDVDATADAAFELCVNVASWPEVFPPCLDARVIEESGSKQKIFLTARANEQVFSWESERRLDRKARRILFSQATPSPLVEYMRGEWEITSRGKTTVIRLTHDFMVRDNVAGLVAGVNTPDEATTFMRRTVDENSTRELNAMAAHLQRAEWRHEFSEAMLINQPRTAIYKLLGDVKNWPWLLPHCNAVDMSYEDPCYQEFTMNVRVGNKDERIRSVRMLRADRIDYFQPEPPPVLKEHQGRWSLRDTAAGVEVTSWHAVVLNPDAWPGHDPDEAKRKVADAINRNSLGTMDAIFRKLGGNKYGAA
jgi:aromatase